jgi:asparagine synthase (glutamine-hydrolysing)
LDVLSRRTEAKLTLSRIVAVFSPSGSPGVRARCAEGLAAAAGNSRWASHALEVGPAALGWTGTSIRGIAQLDGAIAVLDGRFFNRDELPQAPDDASCLIQLYRKYGMEAALARINGDFAFALHDATENRLYAGRDRFGVKPLYWARTTEGIAIASRPRALLAQPGVANTPDRAFVARFAACHYRVFDNPVERSAYADIAQVPAATVIAFDASGAARSSTWWRLVDLPDYSGPEEELAGRYRELLLDAVRRRVEGSHAPAFTLSGGLDSSSVLSCAVAATGERQIAYSSVYADPTFDESADIAPMLERKVSEWRPVPIGNDIDLPGLVAKMVEVNDEPVATATWLSHFVLAEQAARDGRGALFGGLGGDELNAGEYEYFFFRFADLRAAGAERELDHEIECWARHHDHPIWRKNRATALEGIARLSDPARPGGVRTDRVRLERYWAALSPGWYDLAGYEPALDHPFASALKNRTYQDIFRETAPCCLRAEDRHATHFGLERLDPFFDHRLVEFMFRIPGEHKIRDGITKRLLRTAMAGILPDETRLRIKKTGWNAPAHVWFTGRGLDRVRDMVASRAFRERGVYDVAEVERLIDAHTAAVADLQPRENHMMFLWQLMNLETWLASL